jgi:hypothetical protein
MPIRCVQQPVTGDGNRVAGRIDSSPLASQPSPAPTAVTKVRSPPESLGPHRNRCLIDHRLPGSRAMPRPQGTPGKITKGPCPSAPAYATSGLVWRPQPSG